MSASWPLVGRANEIDAVCHALRAGRSALLVGPGGIGLSRLAREAGALLSRLGDVRVVEILDDVDRLDERSAAGFAASAHDHRLIMTAREDRWIAAPLSRLATDGLLERVDVGPLSSTAVDELIAAALGDHVSADLRRWLHANAAGHPGLLAELLADGIEHGAIAPRSGKWRRAPAPAPLTERLLAVAVAHRSTLSPAEWAAREMVAVAGSLDRCRLTALVDDASAASLEARGMLRVEIRDEHATVRIPSHAQLEVVRTRMGPMALYAARARLIVSFDSASARQTTEDRARVAMWRTANDVSDAWQTRAFNECFELGLRGELEEAEAQARAGFRVASKERRTEGRALFGTAMSIAKLVRGRPRSAIAFADDAVRSMLDVDRLGCLAYALCSRAIGFGYLRLPGEAQRAVDVLDALVARDLPPFHGEIARARAWAAVASDEVESAVRMLIEAASDLHARERPFEEAVLLHDLVRLGDTSHAPVRLQAFHGLPHSALTAAAIDHATAHSRDDADGLEAVAGHYDRMGATLLAAEALAQASRVHHRAGDLGRWTLTAAKSRQLAAACEGAATPALTIEDPLTALSKREREVATLAAEGLQDRQIALRLALSVRTVESHLSRAYSRLGIAGRDVIEQLLGSSTPTRER